MTIRRDDDPRPPAERPFSQARDRKLAALGLAGVVDVKQTGVLFDTAKINQGTIALRAIHTRLGGPAGAAPAAARLPPGAISVVLGFEAAFAAAPVICKDTGIAAGSLTDLIERHDQCVVIEFAATEASNQGLDALRLSTGMAQQLIDGALGYLRGRLQAATPDERQRLLVLYGPFIAAVNEEAEARARTRERNDKLRADLDAQLEASAARVKGLEVERRVARGEDVPVHEAAEALRSTRRAPRAKA